MADNNGSSVLPASFLGNIRDAVDADLAQQSQQTTDGRAPNDGNFALPHIYTFQGLLSTVSKIYRASDEALQQSYENARFMLNDVGIQECLLARQRSVALLDWEIVPEEEDNSDHKLLCKQLEKIVNRIKRFTEYRRVVQESIWYGRYGIQHQYRWVNIGGRMCVLPAPDAMRGNIGWMPIHGDKLVFRHDQGDFDEGQWAGQVGVRVGMTAQGKPYEPGDAINGGRNHVEMTDRGMGYFLSAEQRNLILIHKHMIQDGAFESAVEAGKINGVGIRSMIYWEWFQKQATMALIMEYLQRSLGGIELWYYEEGSKTAQDAVKKAAQERQGGRYQLIVPRPRGDDAMAYGVEIIQPDTAGIEAFERVITNFFGHRIKRLILGQTLSSEAAATGLGSGVAELHLDTYMQIIRYDATAQEETITDDLLENIKNWNYPEHRNTAVRFKLKTDDPDIERKMQAWQKAYEMGCRFKEAEVMDTVGASIPGVGDRVLQSPAFTQGAGVQGGAGGMFTGPGPNGDLAGNVDATEPRGGSITDAINAAGGDGASAGGATAASTDGEPGGTGGAADYDADAKNAEFAGELSDEIKSNMASNEIDEDSEITFVNEAGEWVSRETPDAGHDTGDRSREDRYSKSADESEEHSPTLAVDLDGTLAEYDGWKGEKHIGEPRRGARRWMQAARKIGARIIVFTTRGNTEIVREWLESNDIPFDYINENPDQPEGSSDKVIADVYWDDRAVSANGPLHASGTEVLSRLNEKENYSKSADEAAAQTDRNPSDAQKESGNYRKGKFTYRGIPVTIETPQGATRSGTNRDGQSWAVEMPVHYGYINRTTGKDGDHVDVFVGPHESSEVVFVVDQATNGGHFDEHKALIGFHSESKAREAYLGSYADDADKRIRAVTPMTIEQFKNWIESGDMSRPVGVQVSRYSSRSREANEACESEVITEMIDRRNGGHATLPKPTQVDRYARIKEAIDRHSIDRYAASSCNWITVGAQSAGGGKRKGGTPVCVSGGKIVKGPKALSGKTLKGLSRQSVGTKRRQSIRGAAKAYGVDADELSKMVDEMWPEIRQQVQEREEFKQLVRQRMNMTEADVARIENGYRDYSTVHGIDDVANELAMDYPQWFGSENDNPSETLWELLREGKRELPAKHDDEVVDQAARRLAEMGGDGRGDEVEDDDYVPFSRRAEARGLRDGSSGVDRFARIRIAIDRYAAKKGKKKPASGQKSLWNEDDHPRDESGQFAESEGGGDSDSGEGQKEGFSVGDKTYFRGNEITITTLPYEKFGGMWQDGVDGSGKTVTVPTPKQKSDNANKDRSDWIEQQKQFSNLNKPKGDTAESKKQKPTVPGQQTALFDRDEITTGQKSMFNVARPSSSRSRKPVRKIEDITASIDAETKAKLANKETLSPLDLTVKLQPDALEGQQEMFSRRAGEVELPDRYSRITELIDKNSLSM